MSNAEKKIIEIVDSRTFEYKNESYKYNILKADHIEKEIPGFLGYYPQKNGEKISFYISNTTPELYIYPQLIHELIEFTELKDQKGRCQKSIDFELKEVPAQILSAYIKYRKKLFSNLVKYYAEKPESNIGFKKELKHSLEKWEKLSTEN